jgi:hypothetical protein
MFTSTFLTADVRYTTPWAVVSPSSPLNVISITSSGMRLSPLYFYTLPSMIHARLQSFFPISVTVAQLTLLIAVSQTPIFNYTPA